MRYSRWVRGEAGGSMAAPGCRCAPGVHPLPPAPPRPSPPHTRLLGVVVQQGALLAVQALRLALHARQRVVDPLLVRLQHLTQGQAGRRARAGAGVEVVGACGTAGKGARRRQDAHARAPPMPHPCPAAPTCSFFSRLSWPRTTRRSSSSSSSSARRLDRIALSHCGGSRCRSGQEETGQRREEAGKEEQRRGRSARQACAVAAGPCAPVPAPLRA